MQPSSFQYQPINLHRNTAKTPHFFSSKILDKSAPNIVQNRPTGYLPNALSKETDSHHNSNKSTYLTKKEEIGSGAFTPKGFGDKQQSHGSNNLSSPALKFYHSPQVSKNQERGDRGGRGEMSRSLIVEESEHSEGPGFTEMSKKTSDPSKQSPPQRRPPRMSEGYQPYENNFLQHYTNVTAAQESPGTNGQKQSNFMKIKKLSQDKTHEKKPNVPAFLARNVKEINHMKRSSLELYNSSETASTEKTLASSSSQVFTLPRNRKKVSAQDFQKMKELGNGKYGRVYLVREKSTGFICALKVIEKNLLIKEEITEQFIRELKIQMFLNHPNIIKMYGYFDDDKNIYIILEVGTGGQLYHYLKKSQTQPEAKVAFLMKQICDAVNEIHSLRIIHRDIKPQNIVLHDNIIKLCDFGWSVHQDNKLRTTFCGTPLYVCPEILRGKQYDEKIDIWSLGIMMYQMVVGENPFNITKEEELIKIIKDEIKIPSYVYVSSEARDFLDKCLQKNPNDRVTIRELVNHPFLKKYQEKEKKSFNL